MRIAARLTFGGETHQCVALSQVDARVLRCRHELLSCSVEQAAVGGMCDHVGMICGVQDRRRKGQRQVAAFPGHQHGTWRDEHLFLLKQSLAIFDDLAKRVQ